MLFYIEDGGADGVSIEEEGRDCGLGQRGRVKFEDGGTGRWKYGDVGRRWHVVGTVGCCIVVMLVEKRRVRFRED